MAKDAINDSLLLTFVAEHWIPLTAVLTTAWLAKNYFCNGLNKYPGPKLAALTDWWRFWVVWGRRPEVVHLKLHEKHGDVVRLGPNSLSFANPEALKTIYGLNKGMTKSDFYVVQQAVMKGHSLASLFSTTDETFHARFRRCVNAAFSMSALVQYEPFVDNTTRLFLTQTERLFADNPEGCDFPRWLQFYAFDVIGEITYGKRHGFIEKNEDVEGIVAYLSKLFCYVAPIGQMPWLDKLLLKNPIYLKLAQHSFIDATFPVAKFARARMAERLHSPDDNLAEKNALIETTLESSSAAGYGKNKVASTDLLTKFLAAQEKAPDFMNDTLVQTMAVSMAFAGSETTAISLAAVFYYLLRTPSAMARLRDEIDTFGREGGFEDTDTGLVTWPEAQKLPYLDACVKEAFRMHPAAGLPLERIVPVQGIDICGTFVPGGTIVGASAWVIHRRPEIWGADADVYRPERWLVDEQAVSMGMKTTESEEKRIREMNGMMLQFGMGSRTCIGKNISLLEIYKLVPSLLRRFEIEFKDPREEWELINAWFVKQQNFNVKFQKREIVVPTA